MGLKMSVELKCLRFACFRFEAVFLLRKVSKNYKALWSKHECFETPRRFFFLEGGKVAPAAVSAPASLEKQL